MKESCVYVPEGHSLIVKLYIVCDSYVGADHDIGLEPVGFLKERRVIVMRIWVVMRMSGLRGFRIFTICVLLSCSCLILVIFVETEHNPPPVLGIIVLTLLH